MIRQLTLSSLLLFALGAQATLASGGGVERRHLISLASQPLDVSTHVELAIPGSLRHSPNLGAEEVVLVKFPGPVSAAQRDALEAETLMVYTYLPHDTFLVKMRAGSLANSSLENLALESSVLAALGVSWVGSYHPIYKQGPAVRGMKAEENADPAAVMLHLFPDVELAAVHGRLADLGLAGKVVGARARTFFSRIRLLLTPGEIARYRDALARLEEVFYFETEPRRVLLNDTTIWVGQSGLDGGQATPVFDHGLHGEGEILAVLDTGIDPDMCFFRDPENGLPPTNLCDGGTLVDLDQRKIIAVDFLWSSECSGGISATEWDTQDHGTHVAGIALGDDLANLIVHDASDGMAPGAKLVMQDGGFATDACADLPGLGCPVVDLVPIFQQAWEQGARIHTNSWGDAENAPFQSYTAGSQDADEFMWQHKDFLLFFAAGNEGPSINSVSSPSTAKNVVSVGSTQRAANANFMSSFSSCGFTDDGRIKPDITMPGSSIISANNDGNTGTNNCGNRSLSGTSMATPAAAGGAALVRQFYSEGWYPTGSATPADALAPSAALVKATLLNSTREMTGASAIPSDCQGWGRVVLDDALHFSGDSRRLWLHDDETTEFSDAGQSSAFHFEVDTAEPLRVTLVWTDFPSTPIADPHLNNDLDLVVEGPGETWLGNVWSAGSSTAGGNPDRLNTVEQVLLPAPIAGTYTVTVSAFNIPNPDQPFALVVTGEVAISSSIFEVVFENGSTSAWSATISP
jgi:subtilisin family serine protease